MIKHKPLKTSFYLFLINGLTLCFGFISFIVLSLNTLEKTSIKQTQQNLRTFAYAIEKILMQNQAPLPQLDNLVKQIASHDPGFRISIIAEDGTVLGDSDADPAILENHLQRTEVRSALAGKESSAVRVSTVYAESLVYYAIPFQYQNRNLALRLSIPVRKNVFFSSTVRTDSIVSAVIVLLIVLVISFAIAARIISPLEELEKAAQQYKQGDFDYVPAVSSPREFSELAETFSGMARTIQKNIEDISRRRDKFVAVFSGITEALILFDESFQIQEMNDAARDFFSVPQNAPLPENKSLIAVLRNTDIINFIKDTVHGSGKKNKTEIETQLLSSGSADSERNGTRSVLVRCVTIKTTVQPDSKFLLVITDISRLKRLERVRKDFVANVSHELKTPITSIKGFIETLQDGALNEPETAKRFLSIMDQQSTRLINIIEDLLTLSKLEQTGFTLATQQTTVQECVADVLLSQQIAADAKHIAFRQTYVPENDPIRIAVNEGLFEQALGNIVNNAVKYCPDGSTVSVSAERIPAQEGTAARRYPAVKIVIEDDGAGIPEEYRKRIFERFFRVDKGRSRETGGTGLGLSIARHIVELHGGTIRACGRPGGEPGACFEITLPDRSTEPAVS